MKVVKLKDIPFHSARYDGKIINTKTQEVVVGKLHKDDGTETVLLPVKGKVKRQNLKVDELIAQCFLPKPEFKNARLFHKNGNIIDSMASNLEWVDPLQKVKILGEVEYRLPEAEQISDENVMAYKPVKQRNKRKNGAVSEEQESEEQESEEQESEEQESEEQESEEQESEEQESEEQESEEQESEEQEDLDVKKQKEKIPPHEPVYKKFVDSSRAVYNIDNSFEMDGKLWKVAMYKKYPLYSFYISENMDLYSVKKKKILTGNDVITHVTGERFYMFCTGKTTKMIYLKDILASTFLKVPENAVMSVRLTRMRNEDDKIFPEDDVHYRDLIWLTTEDFKKVKGMKEKLIISRRGDLYYKQRDMYRLKAVYVAKNGLRKTKLPSRILNISVLTALAFIERKDETYRYLIHRDNDLQNDNWENLLWVKSLEGRHSDGVYYYGVPGFPEYLLSETNVPYSYKSGVLKQMNMKADVRGYKNLKLRKNKKMFTIRFNRLVAATRNPDYRQDLVVDHKDVDKGNDIPENLRSVSVSENNYNRRPLKGKKIMAIGTDGTITHYDNVRHASSVLGNPYTVDRIRRCAVKNDNVENGKYTYGDYIWKYPVKLEKYVCKSGEYFVNLFGNFQGIELFYENYMISNFGTVINSEKGFAKKITDPDYPTVYFNVNGRSISELVHVLLALVFLPGRTEAKCHVNHLNEIHSDFRLENLQWDTREGNVKYSSYKQGIPVKKICMETGRVLDVYDSRTEAADSVQGSINAIRNVCIGQRKDAYGFFWKDIPEEDIPNYPELTLNQRKLLRDAAPPSVIESKKYVDM